MSALIFTAVWGIVLMFSGLFAKDKSLIKYNAIFGVLIAFIANILDYNRPTGNVFYGMLQADHFSILFNAVILGCTLVYFLLSAREFEFVGENVAEYFTLIFFVLCGICIATSFTNLLMLFLSIEIISIPQYILAGSDKKNLKSNEASLKYFLMGAFSTGFLLMGITLIYGATGTFNITQMQFSDANNVLSIVGILLIAMALSFKVSAAPFHFWAPDVYDGSPTVFTAFMATIVKAGLFIAFIRLFTISFSAGNINSHWMLMLEIITAATLLTGNITAVLQQSVKRMLAYSSIAQAGFMLFAVTALNEMGAKSGILLYAAAYSLATIGAFSVLVKMKDYTFDGFNGLGKKEPLLALTNTIFLLSLAGIPATAGFMAKYFVLAGAVQQGSMLWLVILAIICAAISVYYYFRLIMAMYFKTGDPELHPVTPGLKAMLVITALLIIIIGVFPNLLLQWI